MSILLPLLAGLVPVGFFVLFDAASRTRELSKPAIRFVFESLQHRDFDRVRPQSLSAIALEASFRNAWMAAAVTFGLASFYALMLSIRYTLSYGAYPMGLFPPRPWHYMLTAINSLVFSLSVVIALASLTIAFPTTYDWPSSREFPGVAVFIGPCVMLSEEFVLRQGLRGVMYGIHINNALAVVVSGTSVCAVSTLLMPQAPRNLGGKERVEKQVVFLARRLRALSQMFRASALFLVSGMIVLSIFYYWPAIAVDGSARASVLVLASSSTLAIGVVFTAILLAVYGAAYWVHANQAASLYSQKSLGSNWSARNLVLQKNGAILSARQIWRPILTVASPLWGSGIVAALAKVVFESGVAAK